MKTTFYVILYGSLVPIVVATTYALIVYKRLHVSLKRFSWFIVFSCIIQLASLFYALQVKNNMWLLHVYIPLGFLLLVVFYTSLFKNYIKPSILYGSSGILMAFSVLNSIFYQPITTFNSNAITLEAIFILIICLFTYQFLLSSIVRQKHKGLIQSVSWINGGLFIYYASTLLIFYFGKIILEPGNITFAKYAWLLHSFFSVVMYICFTIGLWKQPKT